MSPRFHSSVESLEIRALLTISFRPQASLPSGDMPRGVLLADFNGDTQADLVTTYAGDNRVTIRLGHGDATFGPESTAATGGVPVAVAAADLNHDGKLDLASTNAAANDIAVVLGLGDGSFGPVTHYAAGGGPRAIAIADLDRDGSLDLVVANQGNDLSLFFGHGDGTFENKTTVSLQDQACDVKTADMNEDGAPDILVAGNASLYLYLNDGAGHFATPNKFPTGGTGGLAVAMADLNGDNHLDAGETNSSHYFVSTFLGNGQGDLNGPSQFHFSFNPWVNPYDLDFPDLDRDGSPDMLVAGFGGVHLRPGRGDGTFSEVVRLTEYWDASDLAVGDVNGDGWPDIIASDPVYDRLILLLNTSGGSTYQIHQPNLSANPGATSITITVDRGGNLGDSTTVVLDTKYGYGSAHPLLDYRPISTNITFAPGETSRTVEVLLTGSLSTAERTIGLVLHEPNSSTGLDSGTIHLLAAPAVYIGEIAVIEGPPGTVHAAIPVRLAYAATVPVTVHYQSSGGTAVSGVDYSPVQGAVTIAPGDTAGAFLIPIHGNLQVDGNRTVDFVLPLANPPAGGWPPEVVSQFQHLGTLTIQDDETASHVWVDPASLTLAPGQSVATIRIVRDDPRSEGVTVAYHTVAGTALSGTDFIPTSGVVTFGAGQTEQFVSVSILPASAGLPNRTFDLVIEPNAGTSLVASPSRTAITIVAPPVTVTGMSRASASSPVVATVNGPLDAQTAQMRQNYKMLWLGRDGKAGTRDDRWLKIRSVKYDASSRTIRIWPAHLTPISGAIKLTILDRVLDARGWAIDGNGDGQPGGDFHGVVRIS